MRASSHALARIMNFRTHEIMYEFIFAFTMSGKRPTGVDSGFSEIRQDLNAHQRHQVRLDRTRKPRGHSFSEKNEGTCLPHCSTPKPLQQVIQAPPSVTPEISI